MGLSHPGGEVILVQDKTTQQPILSVRRTTKLRRNSDLQKTTKVEGPNIERLNIEEGERRKTWAQNGPNI